MNQKGFVNIILIVAVVALVSVAGYFILMKKSENTTEQPPITPPQTPNTSTTTPPIISSENYNTELLAECVKCVNGETWNNKPCCTANFEKDCTSKNGVVRWSDLHPVFPSVLRGCFQKAPDTGKECASGKDCLSGVCDLENAVKSNKCTLIKKEFTGEKSRFKGQEFYTASYSCGTPKPGACTETILNRVNPGGLSHTFEMNNETLIETLESGPIF